MTARHLMSSRRLGRPSCPPALRTCRTLLVAGVAALALAGCATNGTAPGGGAPALTGIEAQAAIPELAARYRTDPGNRALGMAYASALRGAGQSAQAVVVMEQLLGRYPDDQAVSLDYAKALTAEGRFEQALAVAENATDPVAPHWEALSVRGAILDQLGEHGQARAAYEQALILAPAEAGLRANLGLSYAMTGDLGRAEGELRNAVALPGASSQVRQNLALVVGLQGRFAEAQALYAQELPPQEVEANMAYIRAMLSQQNRWEQISAG